jgi:hypothetical protein
MSRSATVPETCVTSCDGAELNRGCLERDGMGWERNSLHHADISVASTMQPIFQLSDFDLHILACSLYAPLATRLVDMKRPSRGVQVGGRGTQTSSWLTTSEHDIWRRTCSPNVDVLIRYGRSDIISGTLTPFVLPFRSLTNIHGFHIWLTCRIE